MAVILAVDDESGIRAFVAEVLADAGHEVLEAADGAAALRELEDRPVDVMLLDLRMPGELGGLDVLRRARAEWPETQVIVLTAWGTVGTAVEAMRLGAFDFLEKPMESPAAVRRLVTRALNWRGAAPARRAPAELPAEDAAEPSGERRGRRGASALLRGFLGELKRRHVYNVAATYAAVAFVGLQALQLVLPVLPVPAWTYGAMVATTVAGFPLALLLGWAYDITLTRTSRAGVGRA